MKDWFIKSYALRAGGKVTHLYHIHHYGLDNCVVQVSVKGRWFCSGCGLEAPEEISFCAELARCDGGPLLSSMPGGVVVYDPRV